MVPVLASLKWYGFQFEWPITDNRSDQTSDLIATRNSIKGAIIHNSYQNQQLSIYCSNIIMFYNGSQQTIFTPARCRWESSQEVNKPWHFPYIVYQHHKDICIVTDILITSLPNSGGYSMYAIIGTSASSCVNAPSSQLSTVKLRPMIF